MISKISKPIMEMINLINNNYQAELGYTNDNWRW